MKNRLHSQRTRDSRSTRRFSACDRATRMARAGSSLPLTASGGTGSKGNEVTDHAAGLGADQHVADGCSGLEARGDIRGIAATSSLSSRRNHFARVDPDRRPTRLRDHAGARARNITKVLPAVPARTARKRHPSRSWGMRTPPSGIASKLHDPALLTLDGLGERPMHAIHHSPRRLGIEALLERSRAREVGEHDRDDLPRRSD